MKKIIFYLLVAFSITACKKRSSQNMYYIDPKFSPYIAAYSSGLVSTQDPIKVVLQNPIEDSSIVQEKNLFSFSPSLKGYVSIQKGNTLVFTPEEPLKQDQLYEAEFKLNKTLKNLPDIVRIFPFGFQTLKQDFTISIESIQSLQEDKNRYKVSGKIESNDFISNENVEKIFRSKFRNKEIQPSWSHEDHVHYFTFTEIKRDKAETDLAITLEGKEMGAEEDEEKNLIIPQKNDFKLIQIKAYSHPEQYIAVNFSQPIADKDFEGMFSLENENLKSILLDGNIVKLYPSSDLSGKYTLTIWNGIEDIYGNKTTKKYEQEIQLNSLLPKVEFVGSGNIVPIQQGVKVPFRAIGLKAVDVKVTKIFKNNIHQFFQFNQYADTENLTLVGREIYTTTVNLNQSENFNSEQSKVYAVDIGKITAEDPGAMYNIELSFQQKYANTPCDEDGQNGDRLEVIQPYQDDWDKNTEPYSYYNYYYPDNYNWEDKDNPCTPSYYTAQKFVNKNILATNVGITAKISSDRKLFIALSDLLSTEAIKGAEIEAYDLQNQIVNRGKTNGKGLAVLPLARKPFLIKATHDKQSTYLRVDDGSVLNYSNFDIDGTKMKKGINGFIYGERGVWRPGDSIFITFVAHSDKELPKNIPATFQLFNTDQQLIDSRVSLPTGDNFYTFKTQTQTSDKTGNYQLNVNFAGVQFEKSLKIETIKPNRLKINTIYPSEVLLETSPPIEIESHWLTGGSASGMKVVTETSLSKMKTEFKGFKNYIFDDPSKSLNTEPQVVLSATLNTEGKAKIPNTWHPQTQAPGMLKVAFFTKVFEKGGDFSSSYSSAIYSPYTSYVGFRLPSHYQDYGSLNTNENHHIQIVTCTDKGAPINGKVEVSLYKINNSWWYNSNSEDLAYYINDSYHAKVKSETLATTNGKATFSFSVKDENWGNYFIHIKNQESGHCAGKQIWIDSPYWYGAEGNDESAALMVLQSDKDQYKVGETATITLPKSLEGKALVSYENGSTVIKEEWIDTQAQSTQIKVPITEDLAPNFYLNISLLQPHQNTKNDLPIRMYGVKNISVENPKRKLELIIKAPSEIEPQKSYNVSVSEKNGKPMTYTLAVVDEGLLDITNFKTPDIYAHFNNKQSLGVKTWDIYNYVLGAYGGKIESVFAIGGDMALQQANKEKINRFKPVVTYIGPFVLGKNKTQKHTLKMPNYVGSAKVMVVAANESAFGSQEANITVKQPLMTLSSLARTLSPGDEISLPVNVFVGKNSIHSVALSLQTNNKLEVIGEKVKNLSFTKSGEQIVDFTLKVKEQLGKATIKIDAKGGSYSSSEDFEVEVRAPNPVITKTDSKECDGTSITFAQTPFGLPTTHQTTIEISTLPISNFEGRLNGLIHYPHGCIEQTISGAFPQLYLSEITNLSNSQSEEIQKHIKYTVEQLTRFQQPNGGMSYWPGGSYASEWGSIYAMHFLGEAEKKGYEIPSHLKNNLLNYLDSSSKKWEYYSSEYNGYKQEQAYRLYVLTQSKKSNISEMNRLKESALDELSTYLLASAYYSVGKTSIAQNLIKGVNWNIPNYQYNSITYGSSLRDKAMILMCLSDMNERGKALSLLKDIGNALNNNDWYSTQTTGMSLLGISKYLQGRSAKNQSINAKITINGKSKTIRENKSIYSITYPSDIAQDIVIDPLQQGVLFVSVSQSGIPKEVIQESKSNDLSMNVSYYDLNGNSLNVASLPQNTDFEAIVSVTHPGFRDTYENLALTQIFPSGWEIINKRVFSDDYSMPKGVDYQDIRDDRVNSYFNLRPSQSVTIRVRLNATYKGNYILPATQCEAMYDHSISANTTGARVVVR